MSWTGHAPRGHPYKSASEIDSPARTAPGNHSRSRGTWHPHLRARDGRDDHRDHRGRPRRPETPGGPRPTGGPPRPAGRAGGGLPGCGPVPRFWSGSSRAAAATRSTSSAAITAATRCWCSTTTTKPTPTTRRAIAQRTTTSSRSSCCSSAKTSGGDHRAGGLGIETGPGVRLRRHRLRVGRVLPPVLCALAGQAVRLPTSATRG